MDLAPTRRKELSPWEPSLRMSNLNWVPEVAELGEWGTSCEVKE